MAAWGRIGGWDVCLMYCFVVGRLVLLDLLPRWWDGRGVQRFSLFLRGRSASMYSGVMAGVDVLAPVGGEPAVPEPPFLGGPSGGPGVPNGTPGPVRLF